MRSVALPLVLIGAFGLNVSSYARDVSLGKHTAEEVKSICEKVGGRFSARRNGTLLLDRLPRRSWYRLRRRLQDWPAMRRPSDREQTPH